MKIRIKGKLNNENIDILGIKNNNIITFNLNNKIIKLEKNVLKSEDKETLLEIPFIENKITKAKYTIYSKSLYLSVKKNKFLIHNNQIIINYDIIDSGENIIIDLKYEEDKICKKN